jgi:hypothetical protein
MAWCRRRNFTIPDSVIGSGLWMPEASNLALLRENIDQNSARLKSVLRGEGLRREFFKGIPDDGRKAVKAFVSQNQESALKTKPKVGRYFHHIRYAQQLSILPYHPPLCYLHQTRGRYDARARRVPVARQPGRESWIVG